jgi:hypothetical protein
MTVPMAMSPFRMTLVAAIGVVALAVACSSPSPNAPSVSFATPNAQTPANNSTFNYAAQPLSLKITNATKTGPATTTYSVEVASDSGFANKVFTKDGIAEDPSGATTFSIAVLNGNTAYFWHSRAVVNGAPGVFSATQTFFINPQITIQAPVVFAPANGTSAVGTTPTFTANDASTSGPVGTLFYNFQIANASSFAATAIVATGVIQEQPGQTSYTPSTNLGAGSYYWRVQAQDLTNNITSPFSTVASFNVVPFDMSQAVILDNPPNEGIWPVNTSITSVVFTPISFEVDFDKRMSPDRWPDFPFGDGTIQYTLGMCVNPGGVGQWYCSAVVLFWFGRDLDASTPPEYVGQNWFYDARWAPILGYQPQAGETVGLFVVQGPQRDGSDPTVLFRSNVVFTPWLTNYVLQTGASSAKRIKR